MSDHLDWTDAEAVRRCFTSLQGHLDDLNGVMRDVLRKKRRRQLGHREHRRLYREAWKSVLVSLAYAMPQATAK